MRKILPAPTNTPDDAGPYLTLGMCYAHDPETGAHDVTIHRMCLQGPDELTIYMVPGARHIGHFYEVAEARGEALPISISIGVDPAIEVSTCFEPPTTPLGYDELSIAGALRDRPVELAPCLTIDELASRTPSTSSRARFCRTCVSPRTANRAAASPCRNSPATRALPCLRSP
ncbi:MAG: UbiD family decarboxylase domain-containing protein [Eggerthellaceae bacterium]